MTPPAPAEQFFLRELYGSKEKIPKYNGTQFVQMHDERTSWNERYRKGDHGPSEPDPLLVHAYEEFLEPVFPNAGHTLDLAGGLGRHAIWLAQRGWRVKLLDISDVVIAEARRRAGPLMQRVDFEVEDTTNFRALAQYDLVLVFFFLQRQIFSDIVKALRPGGVLIYKTYTELQLKFGKGPTDPMHLLRTNELLHSFQRDLKVLHYAETVRERGIAEFVGRKP